MNRTPDIEPIRDASFGFGFWPWSKGKLFELREDHRFVVDNGGFYFEYTIPSGYQFDKASVPPIFWGFPFNYTPDGLCTVPALEHDFLCDLFTGGSEWLKSAFGGVMPSCPTAAVIHKHFHLRLLEWGVRPSKAKVFWEGVRNFGPGGKMRPSTWFKRTSMLTCALFLTSCAGEIAGLNVKKRDEIYSNLAIISGHPEYVPVIFGVRRLATLGKQPIDVSP